MTAFRPRSSKARSRQSEALQASDAQQQLALGDANGAVAHPDLGSSGARVLAHRSSTRARDGLSENVGDDSMAEAPERCEGSERRTTTSLKPALVVAARADHQAVLRERENRRFSELYSEFLNIEAEDARAAGAIGFVANWLVHATLPYKEPRGNPPAWGRRSGDVSLMLTPGYFKRPVPKVDGRGRVKLVDEVVSVGYPFGANPRLALAWLTTEAVRTRSRELTMGSSLNEVVRTIRGSHPISGGSRGTVTSMRNQLQRLFACTIAVTKNPEAMSWANEGFRIVDSSNIDALYSADNPTQDMFWRSGFTLTERFFNAVTANPVPVDMRILSKLAYSPMAMDIYAWLTYRFATLTRPRTIRWEALMTQFGSESRRAKFRENFERNLRDVLVVYPQAKLSSESKGLVLIPSSPSVARRAPKQLGEG